jgi:hypothetical protein
MNFEQYFKSKTILNNSDISLSINNSISEIIAEQLNNDWYISKNEKNIYLHYKDKQLNLTNLKNELKRIYTLEHLENAGFARLSEIELCNSKKIQQYLLKFFNSNDGKEINPTNCALFLRKKDYVGTSFNDIEKLEESSKIIKEKFLTEEPHVELEDEYGDLRFWDFCAEEDFHNLSNGGWLQQLINLYTPPYEIRSLNPNKNDPRVLKLTKKELPAITKILIHNPFFINIAKNDLKNASAKFNLKLKNIIPSELYAKIN